MAKIYNQMSTEEQGAIAALTMLRDTLKDFESDACKARAEASEVAAIYYQGKQMAYAKANLYVNSILKALQEGE